MKRVMLTRGRYRAARAAKNEDLCLKNEDLCRIFSGCDSQMSKLQRNPWKVNKIKI